MESSMRRTVLLSFFVLAFTNIHGAFAAAPGASSTGNFSAIDAPTSLIPTAPANGGVSTINSREKALNELKRFCIRYLQGTEKDNEINKFCSVFKLDSKALEQSPKALDLPMSLADQKKDMQATCKIGLSFPKSKTTEKDTLEKACKELGCNAGWGNC
jgi:hypothetical protein